MTEFTKETLPKENLRFFVSFLSIMTHPYINIVLDLLNKLGIGIYDK